MSTANAIRIKRRKYNDPAGAGKPNSLQWGELAYNEVDNILYYGYGSGTTDEEGAISSINQYPIGGSGQYVDRYSDQAISGDKTFIENVNITGTLTVANITFNQATVVLTSMNAGSGGFDALSASGLDVIAPNTANNDVEYFAVFDANPNNTLTTLKSVSKSEILDDIGAAASGLIVTAGSGLEGGGSLSGNISFDIITGYGIDIYNDGVVVDTNEVVVTTGTQTVSGIKTFANNIVFESGILSSGTTSLQAAASSNSGTYFPVFTGSPVSESKNIVSRTASEVKSDIGLGNVTNDAQVKKLSLSTNGYVPTWNGTTGDALNDGYSVETTLTGANTALPRADAVKTYVDNLLASNDAMIFKGVIDASTYPPYPSGDRGHTYKISVTGHIGGESGPIVEVNDTIICTTDVSPSGYHDTVGDNWVILQTNIVDKDILVTGPGSSVTSGNIAVFHGTAGTVIKDVGLESSKIVMTTGNQSISGVKVFTSSLDEDNGLFVPISGSDDELRSYFKGMDGNYTPFEIIYNNADNYGAFYLKSFNGTVSSNVLSSVSGTDTLDVDSATTWTLNTRAANLGSAASYFPVFNENPNAGSKTIYSRTAAQVKSDIGLGNVENTALSDWAGSTNITTLGTVTTGTWNATTIAVNKGGTGQTSYANGELLIGSGTSLAKNTLTAGDGISITNGSGQITVATDSYVVKTTGNQTIAGIKTFINPVTITGSPILISNNILQGNIFLNNTTANTLHFNASGVSAAPTDDNDPIGTKILLKPMNGQPSVSLGLNSSSWWHSVPTTSWDYEWHAGGSKIATLFGNGTFNTTNISGTNFYINGIQLNSTATQLNLLSGGSDGQILYNSNGSFGLSHFTTPLFAYLTSPDTSINIVYNGDQAVQITHADTSSATSTSYPSGTVVGNLTVDDYGHITNISGTNLDDRYVKINDLNTSLSFVSGITSEYDINNQVLTVYHDNTSPDYDDESNTIGSNGIASITFDRYGHITDAQELVFLTADTVCDAITGCTIDGGTF